MAIESQAWITAFIERDARGEATAADYRRMAAHIQASCEEIRQDWSEGDECYRRTGQRSSRKLPFTVATVSLGEITAAIEPGNTS